MLAAPAEAKRFSRCGSPFHKWLQEIDLKQTAVSLTTLIGAKVFDKKDHKDFSSLRALSATLPRRFLQLTEGVHC